MGALFRATLEQCEDFIEAKTLDPGTADGELCRKLADRLEKWRAQNPNGAAFERSTEEMRELLDELSKESQFLEWTAPAACLPQW
jgi:hypothetical protein